MKSVHAIGPHATNLVLIPMHRNIKPDGWIFDFVYLVEGRHFMAGHCKELYNTIPRPLFVVLVCETDSVTVLSCQFVQWHLPRVLCSIA